MPALANIRHERFARVIVQGLADGDWSQGRAYKQAGYQVTNQNSADAAASRLLRRVKPVLDRVRELQDQAARKAIVTVESIAAELDEARELAHSTEQAGAMVTASATKAKLYGLFVDKHEHGTPGSFNDAQSTQALADAMLIEANPGIKDSITDAMREMALAELARHADAMAAIASGDLALTQ